MSSSMDLLKLLECPICLQTLELPESLPCLHTFCALCIREHIAKSTNRAVCPICRQAVPISAGSSNLNSVLKKDFFKAEMLELLSKSAESEISTSQDANVTSTAKVNKRPLPPLPPETASTNRSANSHSSSRSSPAVPVALRRPVAPPPPPRPPSSAVDSGQRHSVVNQPAPEQHNNTPTLPPRGDRSSSAAVVASNRFTPADISFPVTSLSESSQSQRSDSPILGSLSSLFPSASRNDVHANSPRVADNTTVSGQDLQHQSASSQLTRTPDANVHFPVTLRSPANKPLPVPPLAARNSQLLPPSAPLTDSAPSSSSSSVEGRPPKPPLPNKPTIPSLLYTAPAPPLVPNFLSELEREAAINASTVNSDNGLVMVTDHFGNRDDSIHGNSSLSLNTVVPLTGTTQRHVAHTDSVTRENNANNIDTGDRTSAAPAPIVVSLGDDFDEMQLSLGGSGAGTQSSRLPSPLLAPPPRNRLRNRPVSLCLFADVQPNAPFFNYDKRLTERRAVPLPPSVHHHDNSSVAGGDTHINRQ